MLLTTLYNRAKTPAAILRDWEFYEKTRPEALAGKLGKRCTVLDDTREAQQAIQAALRNGQQPAQSDLDVRTPNYRALVAQYAREVCIEHRSAAAAGIGNREAHVDAFAAWRLVVLAGGNAGGTIEKLTRLVAIAEARTVKLVEDARAERSRRKAA